jgi:hypothetical protein
LQVSKCPTDQNEQYILETGAFRRLSDFFAVRVSAAVAALA